MTCDDGQVMLPAGSNANVARRAARTAAVAAAAVDAQTATAAAQASEAGGQRCMQFRPCIDIHKGKVKQIVGSTLKDLPPVTTTTKPATSPELREDWERQEQEQGAAVQEPVVNFESGRPASDFAHMYRDDGLTGGHVIMLGADPLSDEAALGALRAYPGGLQLGGGVNPDNATKYLDAGASHVIVTSYVFREGMVDRERLRALVQTVGKQRLVLDLSCRKKDGKYMVVTDRWQRFSDLVVDKQTLEELAKSADEFLVHGVDVEGFKLGIDRDLVELLGRFSPIPVTYAGGARTLEDLETVRAAGNGRVDVTVGSALDIFGGNLKYADVVAWHHKQQQRQ